MSSAKEQLKQEVDYHVKRFVKRLDTAEADGFLSYEDCIDDEYLLFIGVSNGSSYYVPPYIKKKLKRQGFYVKTWGGGILTDWRYYIKISRKPLTLWQRIFGP